MTSNMPARAVHWARAAARAPSRPLIRLTVAALASLQVARDRQEGALSLEWAIIGAVLIAIATAAGIFFKAKLQDLLTSIPG